jgi:hypothetical protein
MDVVNNGKHFFYGKFNIALCASEQFTSEQFVSSEPHSSRYNILFSCFFHLN